MERVKLKKKIKKEYERGQLAMEAVLLVVLFVSLAIFASREIKNRNFMGKMVSGPWKVLAGVMATGNWKATDEAFSNNLHPHVNTQSRTGD